MSIAEGARVRIDLTDEENELLRAGVGRWSSTAQCTPEYAVAIGFTSVHDSEEQRKRIELLLQEGNELLPIDWARALLTTEIAFISNAVGEGDEWGTITGIRDEQAIKTLRSIQRKLMRISLPLVRSGFGARPDA